MITPRTLAAGMTGALLLAGLTTGIAQAQPADPQVVVVTPVVTCGKVTVTFDNPDVGSYVWGWATGPYDVAGEVGATGTLQVPKGRSTRVVELPEDAFGGRGFVTLSVVAGPNTHRQAFRDLGLVDTDCAPPVVTTTTPAPTTTPARSTSTSAPVPTTSAPSSTTLSPVPIDVNGDGFTQVDDVPTAIETGRA